MSKWGNIQVNEFSEVISGATPTTNTKEYWDGGIEWITPADLSKLRSRFIEHSDRTISLEGLRNTSVHLTPKNNIVMSSRAPIGYFAIPINDFTTNQGCKTFILKSGHDPDYHYYNFLFNIGYIKRFGGGSTFAEISKSDVEKLIFKITTDPAEQRKIARILSTVDSVIEETEAAIAKYKAIKQGMMQDLFTRGLDKSGKLRPRCQETPELYKKTGLGWIPKEWDTVRLGEMCNLRRGASPRPIDDPKYFASVGRGWVRISDVTSAYKYLTKTTQRLSELGETLSVKVNPGELIMSICATLGRPIIVDTEVCIHDGFVFFKDIEVNLNIEFVFYFLLLNEAEISKNKQIGTQGNLNTSIVNAILIPKPKSEEQLVIAKRLSGMDSVLNSEEMTLNKFVKVKSALMSVLLTGKVPVKYEEEKTNTRLINATIN